MQFKKRWAIVFALVTLSLSLSPSLRAQDALMTPQDIQSAWVGKTVVATISGGSSAGRVVELQLKAEGVARLGGALFDTGTWRLSENGYCVTWKKIRAGEERCLTASRKGGEIQILNPDGSLNSTVTQVR